MTKMPALVSAYRAELKKAKSGGEGNKAAFDRLLLAPKALRLKLRAQTRMGGK